MKSSLRIRQTKGQAGPREGTLFKPNLQNCQMLIVASTADSIEMAGSEGSPSPVPSIKGLFTSYFITTILNCNSDSDTGPESPANMADNAEGSGRKDQSRTSQVGDFVDSGSDHVTESKPTDEGEGRVSDASQVKRADIDDEWGVPLAAEQDADTVGQPADAEDKPMDKGKEPVRDASQLQDSSGAGTITEAGNETLPKTKEPLDVLIPVASIGTSQIKSKKGFFVTFPVNDGRQLPGNTRFVTHGVNTKVAIQGDPVAPRLRFTATANKQSKSMVREIIHEGLLDFDFFNRAEIADLTFTTMFTPKPAAKAETTAVAGSQASRSKTKEPAANDQASHSKTKEPTANDQPSSSKTKEPAPDAQASSDMEKSKRGEPDSKYINPCFVDVTFRTSGGVGHGLKAPSDMFKGLEEKSDEAALVLRHMRLFVKPQEEKVMSFRIHLSPRDAEDWDSGSKLRELLGELRDTESVSWKPYLHNTGKPATQYNQFRTREAVADGWETSYGISSVPVENHFHDLTEAQIKLANAASLEHRVASIHQKRIMDRTHEVVFLTLDGSPDNVIAAVKLAGELNEKLTPQSMQHLRAVVQDGETITISWLYGGSDDWQKCTGRVVLNIFPVVVQADFVMLVIGKRSKNLKVCLEDFPGVNDSTWYQCLLKFENSDSNVKQQVNAINQLCSDAKFSRWQPTLLNHEYSSLEKQNIFAGIDDQQVSNAFARVSALKKWNTPQSAAFEFLKKLPGGFGVVEGIFGCGKTSVQAAMALLCHYANMHVLLVAPFNVALAELERKFSELDSKTPILRVLQAQREQGNAMREVPGRDHEQDQDDDDQGFVAWLGALQALKDNLYSKFDVMVEHSLAKKVAERADAARANNEVIPLAKPAAKAGTQEGQQKKTKPDRVAEPHIIGPDEITPPESEGDEASASGDDHVSVRSHKSDASNASGPKSDDASASGFKSNNAVDVWFHYLEERSRTRNNSGGQAEVPTQKDLDDQKRQFKRAAAAISKEVMRESRILLCTNQVARSDICRIFGETNGDPSNGIVIISDEDGQTVEPDAWVPITALRKSDDIKGVIRFGDRMQLPPVVLSGGVDSMNEFAPQLSRSLFDRLLRSSFETISLNIQHRMAPKLSDFPSKYTYDDRVLDAESTAGIAIPEPVLSGIKEWVTRIFPKFNHKGFSYRQIGLNVPGSCQIDDRSKSRYNVKNVEVVMSLLHSIWAQGNVGTYSLSVIVPYTAQKTRYMQEFNKAESDTKIPFQKLARVVTIDSAQGHEADVVILDWTVTDGADSSDIGFLQDNRRVNVALSRARSCLITVCNTQITKGALAGRKLGDKSTYCRYEIVTHWEYLQNLQAVLEYPGAGKSGEQSQAEPPPDTQNDGGSNSANEAAAAWGEGSGGAVSSPW